MSPFRELVAGCCYIIDFSLKTFQFCTFLQKSYIYINTVSGCMTNNIQIAKFLLKVERFLEQKAENNSLKYSLDIQDFNKIAGTTFCQFRL